MYVRSIVAAKSFAIHSKELINLDNDKTENGMYFLYDSGIAYSHGSKEIIRTDFKFSGSGSKGPLTITFDPATGIVKFSQKDNVRSFELRVEEEHLLPEQLYFFATLYG